MSNTARQILANRARAGQPRHWTTKPAPEAYADRHALATALIARIGATISAQTLEEGEGVNWGHVGDMAETVRALQQISDRLHAEGEYAPENRA